MRDPAGGRSKLGRDPVLREFVAARVAQLPYRELADGVRGHFGPERAVSSSAIARWDARRRAAKVARSPARGAAGGRTAPEMPLQQRARCSWCNRGFRPRKGTGGSPQRFCGAPCRRTFHSAARRYVRRAIAEGRLTLADLRTLAPAGATSGEMAA